MRRHVGILACLSTALLLAIGVAAQRNESAGALLRKAADKAAVDGDLDGAIELYRAIVDTYGTVDRRAAATALVQMANLYQKLGNVPERQAAFARVVRDFGDQADAVRRAQQNGAQGAPAPRGDRAVWTGPKVDLFGHVSPNGQFISFTDWSTFNNLSLYDLRSNTERPLSGNKGWPDTEPNWGEAQWSAVSPDSQYIAYAWFTAKNPAEVRIMPVSGDNPQPRTLLKFTEAAPGVRDWSPDGKLLALTGENRGGTSQIIVATIADQSTKVLKSAGWRGPESMFFSRDSRYIAYDLPASDDDDVQQRDVFIIAVDGSREVRAVEDAADDRVAGWSPDGRYLLFSSTRTGARSLWALPVSDGRPQGRPELVKTDIGSSVSLGIANSGSLYLHKYVSSRDVKIARIDLNAGTLVGQPVHFSQGLLPSPFTPNWSPDGKFVAYQVRGEEEGFAIRSVETGAVRRFRNLHYVTDPRWSPDGRSLLAQSPDGKGRRAIMQIDAQTGKATVIAHVDGGGTMPRWSPDGRKIYYMGRRPFQEEATPIRERDLRTGTERDVFRHQSILHGFEVSPDGRYLAVPIGSSQSPQPSSILLVPVAGGEPRELVQVPAAATIADAWPIVAWTPDSRALLTARKGSRAVELWLVEVESGRGRKLNIDVSAWVLGNVASSEGFAGGAGGFTLSPDGKSIAFLMGKSGAEVWAMENFLR